MKKTPTSHTEWNVEGTEGEAWKYTDDIKGVSSILFLCLETGFKIGRGHSKDKERPNQGAKNRLSHQT